MITRQCLDYIKDVVDIYDVISPYVSLKKCGANWRGLSPFTAEKTPSFFVISSKRIFKCFSSGNAGDLFRFIQIKENVSFSEAVEMIANRFNIKLEFEDDGIGTKDDKSEFSKNDLFEINNIANTIFVKNFENKDTFGEKIRDYWKNLRKFDLSIATRNSIGFCKNDEKFLIDTLKKNFPLEAIKQCGLFYFKEDSNDLSSFRLRFRFRLTIPIRDIQGRIVGFSARAIAGLTSDISEAKYINSPETPIFHKGNLLFGLHEARLHIGDANEFWLVEGQLDVLRCWSIGLSTAVAPQGTAITPTQLANLRRYSSNLNCLLDGDDSGLRAADRLLQLSMNAGLDTKFYVLPKSEDPDSFFCGCDKDKLDLFIKTGLSAMEFTTKRHFLGSPQMSSRQKADALQKIYEIISCSDSSIIHESLLDEVSQLCTLDRRALSQDFNTFCQRKNYNNPMPIKFGIEQPNDFNRKKIDSAEAQLLSTILLDASVAKKILKVLDLKILESLGSMESKILLKIFNEIREDLWDGIETMNNSNIFSEEEKNVAYSLLAEFNLDGEDFQKIINFVLMKLHFHFYRKKINEIDARISKISLDEKDMIRNLQYDRLFLRKQSMSFPQVKL